MRDRWGKMVFVAWSEREILYLRAIVTMGAKTSHIRELSELNGRSFDACLNRMYQVRRQMRQEEAAAKAAVKIVPITRVVTSFVRPLSRDELMAGR